MLKVYIAVIVVLLLLAGGWYWYQESQGTLTTSMGDLGTYAYECDEHVSFTMTPSSDTHTLTIAPKVGSSYPPKSVLNHVATNSGARYEGNGLVFVAHGESVVLGEGDDALNCSPVSDPDNAPFNFGD